MPSYTSYPLSPMRKVIAARMSAANREIPHFRVSATLEVDAILALRDEHCHERTGPRPSLNDFLVKAAAIALMEVPELNIQWMDGEIRQHVHADIAVIVALDQGLATPIVRQAETKTVWDISREIRSLTTRAKANTLKMDDVSGGTLSISNLGKYAIDSFDAIINAPQCAVLAIGRASPKVVADADRTIRVATALQAIVSADHRALDGVAVARFLGALTDFVERPDRLTKEIMS